MTVYIYIYLITLQRLTHQEKLFYTEELFYTSRGVLIHKIELENGWGTTQFTEPDRPREMQTVECFHWLQNLSRNQRRRQ